MGEAPHDDCHLPMEIWAEIFSFITRRADIRSLRCVCWSWLQLAHRTSINFIAVVTQLSTLSLAMPYIHSRTFYGNASKPHELMDPILRASNLRRLEVLGAHPGMLPYLRMLPLTRLVLTDMDRSGDDGQELSSPLCDMRAAVLLAGLHPLTAIQHLQVFLGFQSALFPGALPCFASWTRLRRLYLAHLPNATSVTHLNQLSRLEVAYLANWEGLQRLTNLQSLSVTHTCPNATVLEDCTFLRSLKLHWGIDHAFSFYSRLTMLTELETGVRGTPFSVLTSLVRLAHHAPPCAVDNYHPLTRLTSLWFYCNARTTFTSLHSLTGLVDVAVYLTDEPPHGDSNIFLSLRNLPRLRKLVLNVIAETGDLDFSPLEVHTALEEFTLFYNDPAHLTTLPPVVSRFSILRSEDEGITELMAALEFRLLSLPRLESVQTRLWRAEGRGELFQKLTESIARLLGLRKNN